MRAARSSTWWRPTGCWSPACICIFQASPIWCAMAQATGSFTRRGSTGCEEHDPEKWKPVFGKDHAQNLAPLLDLDAGGGDHLAPAVDLPLHVFGELRR